MLQKKAKRNSSQLGEMKADTNSDLKSIRKGLDKHKDYFILNFFKIYVTWKVTLLSMRYLLYEDVMNMTIIKDRERGEWTYMVENFCTMLTIRRLWKVRGVYCNSKAIIKK